MKLVKRNDKYAIRRGLVFHSYLDIVLLENRQIIDWVSNDWYHRSYMKYCWVTKERACNAVKHFSFAKEVICSYCPDEAAK
jgi:hypothetical protein